MDQVFVFNNTEPGHNALTYDFKGNLATNAQNAQAYIWDAENRMKSIGNSVDADYRYDALGRRVQKAVTVSLVTTTTTFICGGAQVFTEYVNGVEKQSYVYAFPAGTKVQSKDGAKSIELVEIGDLVLSWDESTNKTGYRRVVNTFTNQVAKLAVVNLISAGGLASIECTDEHPFWTDEHGWVSACMLGSGMTLKLEDGNYAKVDTVTFKEVECVVYNFEVEGWHTYYVLPDGEQGVDAAILVHNTCKGADLLNAIRSFKGRDFMVGNQALKFDRKGLKHILERHHPTYWNGTSKVDQTFFDKNLSVSDLEGIVGSILNQNKQRVMSIGANSMGQLPPTTVNGVRYVLGLNKGRIGQLYPLP